MMFLLISFIDLNKLAALDLSLNNLGAISPSAFTGLTLEYLWLGENPSLGLPTNGFVGMSTRLIDLKRNQLTEITPNFLAPLAQRLGKLFVNGNKITRFSPDLLTMFNGLESIRIQDNPLICDCKSRWLKQFFDQNVDKLTQTNDNNIEPRCSAPVGLSGEFFSRLRLMDFLCDKPSLNSEISFDKSKAMLKCMSTGHPTPQISWYRPSGVIEATFPKEGLLVTEAELEVLGSEPHIQGAYRCVASNEAGNVSLTINVSWPFPSSDSGIPCGEDDDTTSREIVLTNQPVNDDTPVAKDTDVFKKKYFTIIDLIIAVFGTFAGTLIVTVVVLHMCVYRKRKAGSQYSTPPQSEYSSSSIKNEVYNPPSAQHSSMQIPVHTMQNRPLPTPNPKPAFHKAYDENHYMSTQLDEHDELGLRHQHHHNGFGGHNPTLGQHTNGGLVSSPHSPPCQACQTLNSHHHRHSQVIL